MRPHDELLIPIGVNLEVPGSMRGKAIGIGDPRTITESFGRDYKPVMPLMLRSPDKRTVIIVAGMGHATAAELEDLALAGLEREKDSDWEASREAAGYPQQAQLVDNIRAVAEDTLRRIKRNPRTMRTPRKKRVYQGGIE